MNETSRHAISGDALRRLLGDVEDATIARILATGATEAEVLEARQWLAADDRIAAEVAHGRRGVAGEVYEILAELEAPPEER
jgi:hypothetical protein